MGQVIRMMSYSQSKNVANTIHTPLLNLNGVPLSFYNLDDGVMGGQSQTHLHQLLSKSPQVVADQTSSSTQCQIGLVFTGEINTNGGGFTSIRSKLENGIPNSAEGLKIKYKGDGKTYKVLLSDGMGGGPFSSSPSWQCDLPTSAGAENEEMVLSFNNFIPSFGGRSGLSDEERKRYKFKNEEMKQIGIMLSLKLSNGGKNPIETFGSGIFGFRLEVNEIELV